MKKEIKLAEAIGEADDDIIAEAAPKKKQSHRGFITKICAVAACLALVICTLPMIVGNQPDHSEVTKGISEIKDIIGIYNDEIALVSAWRFDIQDSPYSSYKSGKVIDEAFVGDEICEVTVKQYNHLFMEHRDEDISYKKAVLYEIKGISPEVSVCLRYLEASEVSSMDFYYRYTADIDAATLTEYFDKTVAKTHAGISGFSLYSEKKGYTYYDKDAEHSAVLFDMLLSLEGTRALSDADSISKAISGAKNYARIDIESDVTARSRFVVFDNGYVLIYTYAAGYSEEGSISFFRAEKSKNLIDYIRQNCTEHEPVESTVTWSSMSE